MSDKQERKTGQNEPPAQGRLPGSNAGHENVHPLSEYELGERGSYGHTYRLTPRSDEQIWNDVSEAMAECEDLDANDVELRVEHGIVYLDGSVARPHEWRLAQSLAEDVPGVKGVRNALVRREPI